MKNGKRKTRFRGVYQLDNGSYFVRATYSNPYTRKTIEKCKVCKDVSLVDAENERIQIYKKLVEEVHSRSTTAHSLSLKTFASFVSWYFSFCKTHHIRNAGTIIRDRSTTETLLVPILGDYKMCDLKKDHIRHWVDEVQKKRKKNGLDLYSENTFKKAYRLLRAMIRTAYREGVIEADITKDLLVKFHFGNKAKKKSALTMEEVGKLLKVAERDLTMSAYIALGVSSGMRYGEMSALTWDDLNFEEMSINICKSHSQGILSNSVKNGNNFSLPLTDLAKDKLLILKNDQEGKYNPKNLVFLSRKTKSHISTMSFNRNLTKYCAIAGIDKKISSHSLRYSANSIMFLSGVDKLIIQRVLNHQSGDLMSLNYLSIDQEVKKEILDDIFSK